jgi:hypothetical protein
MEKGRPVLIAPDRVSASVRRSVGALDLMTGSPSPVDQRQLDKLGLKIKD